MYNCLVTKLFLSLATSGTVARQASLSLGFSWHTGMGCYFLLQWIFPTQELYPSLLLGRQILHH